MNSFEKRVREATGGGLVCAGLDVMQVNLGLRCNQSCMHCHVSASPSRAEAMDWPTMEMVLDAASVAMPGLVDLTGGAPELNPHFRRLVSGLAAAGHKVQVRTNLSVMLEPGMEGLPEFLSGCGVGLVASMPCYLEENVCMQRGGGVYEKSVEAIRRLNEAGYGVEEDMQLDLVYNPGGAFLPPGQGALEADYRRELDSRFGLTFTSLYTITNMPIGRFRDELRRQEKDEEYARLLAESFNPATIGELMCRHMVSVGWDGRLFDCDFNLALDIPVDHGAPAHIRAFDPELLAGRTVVTGEHCYGCTAGCGSSCAGALA